MKNYVNPKTQVQTIAVGSMICGGLSPVPNPQPPVTPQPGGRPGAG